MHKEWEAFLKKNLEQKAGRQQLRKLKVLSANSGRMLELDGRQLINFAGNNYLGLANDPRLAEAGCSLARRWGAGAGASRLISGSYAPLHSLEEKLARWIGKERALFFNSGYNANLGLLSALADRDTVIFCDRLNHASIYDGIRLSRAKMARYRHRDLDSLSGLLQKYNDAARKIIITDTVFSMEGDIAPLAGLAEIAGKNRALVIADEAHSLGVFGDEGSGLVADEGLTGGIDIIMGTMGKAFGVFGAFAACSQQMYDFLVNNCRPFIFTTALPPFITGALDTALEIIRKEKRGREVLDKAVYLRQELAAGGVVTNSQSQIIPVMLSSNNRAMAFMNYLLENGIFAPAIRPPTVPVNTARVRLSLSCSHTERDLEQLVALVKAWKDPG